MRYYIEIIQGYISSIGTGLSGVEISETEYNEFLTTIRNRPTPSLGYDYQLRADTLEWELVELPPMPEPEPTIEDKAEAYDILIGDAP